MKKINLELFVLKRKEDEVNISAISANCKELEEGETMAFKDKRAAIIYCSMNCDKFTECWK